MTPIDFKRLPAFVDFLAKQPGFRRLPRDRRRLFRFATPTGLGGILSPRADPSAAWLVGVAGDYWERFKKQTWRTRA